MIRLQRGTYEGNVLVSKDGLSIRDAGPGKTMLVANAAISRCGICVEGNDPFAPEGYVHDISIRGLSVVGFDAGVNALAVRSLSVADVEASDSGTDAISVNTSYDVDIRRVRSNAAGSAGVPSMP